jgi:cardiolipin synthase
MLAVLRDARTSIDIEHYIFSADSIGGQFVNVLKEKARAGVQVRLLADAVGSYAFYNSRVPDELRALGAKVRFFNPISPWRLHNFTSWFFRDHNKIMVVDGKVAFTGGTGMRKNMAGWRDTNARIEGGVVGEMRKAFEEMWGQAEDRNIFKKIKKVRAYSRRANFVSNAPYYRKRFLYHALMRALERAERSIWLMTPYFIPDHRLMRSLRLARRRGVDVKIIIPNLVDVRIVANASNSAIGALLRSGVRIFKYQPRILHAKTAVVDGRWATFGSFNLDNLSFRFNFEGNVVSEAAECVNEIEAQFLRDLAECKEITSEEWRHRPLLQKAEELLVAPIRWLL